MTEFPHLFPIQPKPTKPGPYDHVVRVETPKFGLGPKLTDMLAFARDRDERMPQGWAPKGDDRYFYSTFCFADRATADEFAQRFGGELMPE